jgi:hypothetical protein
LCHSAPDGCIIGWQPVAVYVDLSGETAGEISILALLFGEVVTPGASPLSPVPGNIQAALISLLFA